MDRAIPSWMARRSFGSNKLGARSTLKLAVITDGEALQRFALEAVNAVVGCDEVAIFSCTNTRLRRRPVKHGFYYALNLLTVVNPWTRSVPLERLTKRVSRAASFESGYEGAWQTLPAETVRELREYDLILKFGMGLLRVPPAEELPVPILSYHHGDPDKYRGRPGGFWEIMSGEPAMGQIVQAIGNKLDAGQVLAFAETKVLPWSYRATLIESYRHSPLIINEAIRNALAGSALPKPCQGKNYRLPSNAQVVGFVAKMAFAFVRRLVYGALFEKKWKVSLAPLPAQAVPELFVQPTFPQAESWRTLEPARGYTFYADPFFTPDPRGILVEALRGSSGRGEIVLVTPDGPRTVSVAKGHMSYPSTIELDGHPYVVPEMAGWSPPKLFILDDGILKERRSLRIEGDPRIVDPTLFQHEGRIYLFGNIRSVGSNALYLWSAESIDSEFRLHPLSPLRVSPLGSRMAGSILSIGGRLLRLGQDFRFGYGDGIIAFEIEILTAQDYRERPLGALRFSDRHGPHTLNLTDGEIVFDWYRDGFTPFAGLRRLANHRND